MENQEAVKEKKPLLHRLFGSTPGDGELQPKEGISYSIAGFGQNLVCTIIGSYLTVFMTDAIGFNALAVAFLMLFARIYDAMNDPIMGSIVDRTRTPWGKCRPYLKWMPLPIALMTILCFLPVYPNNPGGFAAISVVYIIWGMVYTVADVPYWGLSTAMSNDTFRRGNLLTIARLLCTAGAGIVTIVVPQITSNLTKDMTDQVNAIQAIINTLANSGIKLESIADIATYIHTSGNASLIEALGTLKSSGIDLGAYYSGASLIQLMNTTDSVSVSQAIGSFIDTFNNTTISLGSVLDVNSFFAASGTTITLKIGKETVNVIEFLTGAGVLTSGMDGAGLVSAMNSIRVTISHDLSWIYFVIATVCVVLAIPMFLLGFKNTKERNMSETAPPSLGHNLKLLSKNKPLMLIVLSGILGAAKMGFTYTGGLYFAKYVLSDVSFLGMQGEGLYTLITMSVVPGGLIASVLVPYFTKKFGKRNTYIWSHIVGGVAMAIAFAVGIIVSKGNYSDTATLVVAFLALVIAGFPSGFGNIISYAMIGDTVEYLELKTGERAEGICFAMQTFINKIGMAVGAFIGVLGYYLAGVTPNNAGALDGTGKDIMWVMLMLLGAISFLASAIPLFFYKFNEKEQQEAAAIIKERRAAAQTAKDDADYAGDTGKSEDNE